jgi:hypothetical protein
MAQVAEDHYLEEGDHESIWIRHGWLTNHLLCAEGPPRGDPVAHG